jgi:hypothetical protein
MSSVGANDGFGGTRAGGPLIEGGRLRRPGAAQRRNAIGPPRREFAERRGIRRRRRQAPTTMVDGAVVGVHRPRKRTGETLPDACGEIRRRSAIPLGLNRRRKLETDADDIDDHDQGKDCAHDEWPQFSL